MKNSLFYLVQNTIPVDVIQLNDIQIEALIKKMESDKSSFGFLGYSSALELICKYLDKKKSGRIKADVRSVISISESLNEYTKKSTKKYFGVAALSRYSNLENGIIAQQTKEDSGDYLINTASYVVEIIKMDSNEPVKDGELGRIVVTDLFNYAMPLIRYDTGDVGSISINSEKNGNKYLSTVEGRQLDLLYDTKGDLVSSYIAYKNMWQYTEILQYQLIQVNKDTYIFKINAENKFTKENQLLNELKTYLGNDAKISFEYVSEIPLLSSGKRKKVVNLMIQQTQ